MRREHVRDLLDQVANGALGIDEALGRLSFEPAESLGAMAARAASATSISSRT